MYIERITRRNGDKTKYMQWIYQTKAARYSIRKPHHQPASWREPKRETLTQTRARNARKYKWYFGKVMTYPGFGRGFTYLGAHKVFY